jgi:hypothetical protein
MCDKREKWKLHSLFVYTKDVVGGAREAVTRSPRISVGHFTQ